MGKLEKYCDNEAEVLDIISKDCNNISTDFQIGEVDLIAFWCGECNEHSRVEGYSVPLYCPKCGTNLKSNYEYDGHFVYRTLRLHNKEEF